MSEKKTRTGSENRKRIVKFTARFTEDEAEIVREKSGVKWTDGFNIYTKLFTG